MLMPFCPTFVCARGRCNFYCLALGEFVPAPSAARPLSVAVVRSQLQSVYRKAPP